MSNLPDRRGHSAQIIHAARWPLVASVAAALTMGGAASYWGGSFGSGSPTQSGGVAGSFVYGPPNTPTIDAVVLIGDTLVRLTGTPFVGSGDDDHQASDWWIQGPAGSPNDTVLSSFADTDSLTAITLGNLIPDSVYYAYLRYNGAESGLNSGVDSVEFTANYQVSLYPNRPSGFSLITQFDGTTRTPSGWGGFTATQASPHVNGGYVSIELDTSNPDCPTDSVLVFNFVEGANSVSNATIFWWQGGARDSVYTMWRVKYDTGWEAIGHKTGFWGIDTTGARGPSTAPTQIYPSRETAGYVKVTTQATGSRIIDQNFAVDLGDNDGSWMNIEELIVPNSGENVGDGEYYMWVDNVLVLEATTAVWDTTSTTPAMNGYQWYGTRNTANTISSTVRHCERSWWAR